MKLTNLTLVVALALGLGVNPSTIQADLKANTERLNRYLDQLGGERLERERQERIEQVRQAQLERERQARLKQEHQQRELERLGIAMVAIPGGCFQMGSYRGAKVKKPQHEVCLKGFKLGKYKVTQGQWLAVMGSNPSFISDCGDNCRVGGVSWNEIQQFLQELNSNTGLVFRLPSEAEWVYACLGGRANETNCDGNENELIYWGDNRYPKNSGSKTHGVVGKAANGFGLYDMTGNVWEWTEDCWSDSYHGAPRDGSAWQRGDCSRRVVRGLSWNDFDMVMTPKYRSGLPADTRNYAHGFRLLLQDGQ